MLFRSVLARTAPSISGFSGNEDFGVATPNTKTPQAIVVMGFMNVKCTFGTPKRGEMVYICSTAGLVGRNVGDFEAFDRQIDPCLIGKVLLDGP